MDGPRSPMFTSASFRERIAGLPPRGQLAVLASGWVRKGGKQYRRRQARRMAAFLDYVQKRPDLRVEDLRQLGARHVIAWWKANRELSPSTLQGHWQALAKLWFWLGKGTPPRPLTGVRLAN